MIKKSPASALKHQIYTKSKQKHVSVSQRDFLHPFPKSLPAEIYIGFFVKESSFDEDSVINALNELLKKIEDILKNTPATYTFLLPFSKTHEHEILENFLQNRTPFRKSPVEILLIKKPEEQKLSPGRDEQKGPFESSIRFRIIECDESSKKAGYDAVTDKIAEKSTLI